MRGDFPQYTRSTVETFSETFQHCADSTEPETLGTDGQHARCDLFYLKHQIRLHLYGGHSQDRTWTGDFLGDFLAA